MNAIEIKNITKHFGKTAALQDVSLQLEENKIYGLLGRNGAGKTTLFNVITQRIFCDCGEVLVDSESTENNDRALGKIFLASTQNKYPDRMKLKNIFKLTKHFYPDFDLNYAQELSKSFGLNTNQHVHALSTGYATIFQIILGLSVNARYLLMDEPVLGLDANHRDLFYRLLLEKYSEKPSTIVISTHLIEEISNVIEEIIIIDNGSILKQESTEQLLSEGYTISGSAVAVDEYIIGQKVLGTDNLGGLKSAYVLGVPKQPVPEGLEISRLDLQKLFIQLTNK